MWIAIVIKVKPHHCNRNGWIRTDLHSVAALRSVVSTLGNIKDMTTIHVLQDCKIIFFSAFPVMFNVIESQQGFVIWAAT